jgi:hypothetical protein
MGHTFVLSVEGAITTTPAKCVGLGVSFTELPAEMAVELHQKIVEERQTHPKDEVPIHGLISRQSAQLVSLQGVNKPFV